MSACLPACLSTCPSACLPAWPNDWLIGWLTDWLPAWPNWPVPTSVSKPQHFISNLRHFTTRSAVGFEPELPRQLVQRSTALPRAYRQPALASPPYNCLDKILQPGTRKSWWHSENFYRCLVINTRSRYSDVVFKWFYSVYCSFTYD